MDRWIVRYSCEAIPPETFRLTKMDRERKKDGDFVVVESPGFSFVSSCRPALFCSCRFRFQCGTGGFSQGAREKDFSRSPA